MVDFTLSDELAVRDILARYCHRCDDGDAAGVADLFTPDGAFVFGGREHRGTSAIHDFFKAAWEQPERRGKHLTVNSAVEVDGDRVRAVSDFVFLRGPQLVPALAGRYHDEFVRLDGRWRFTRREALLMG